jgi:Tfp pilus assembly protein PilN
MIQFNLLPDVKLAFVKAQRTKRLVMGSAFIATASAFAIFVLLFTGVHVVQKVRISQLNGDIKDKTAELKENDDLDKVLTIQNQLSSLTGLHDQKVASSRTLAFVQQVTPSEVSINNLAVDFKENTMTITGLSPTLDRVNTFIDTLKYSKYTRNENPEEKKAFSDVVLSQFGRSEVATTYTITLVYDPALFGPEVSNLLIVPKGVTTNSVVDQPNTLFKKIQEEPQPGQQQQQQPDQQGN